MKRIFVFTICATVLFLTGCGKEEVKKLTVTPDEVVVYHEGSSQLTASDADATFKSNDEYYAKVDANGLVTGNKVGKTEVVVSSSNGSVTVPVTVLNKYSLYPDVDGLIGKSSSDVTSVLGSSYETSTTSSGGTMYTYKNPTSYVSGIGVTFNNGICESILIAVPTSNTTMLTKHLVERYTVAGMQNDMYFFVNHDKNVAIALELYSLTYLAVLYYHFDSSRSAEVEPDWTLLQQFSF